MLGEGHFCLQGWCELQKNWQENKVPFFLLYHKVAKLIIFSQVLAELLFNTNCVNHKIKLRIEPSSVGRRCGCTPPPSRSESYLGRIWVPISSYLQCHLVPPRLLILLLSI